MRLDVPQAYDRHAFLCMPHRPPGHPMGVCSARGAGLLWEYFAARIDKPGTDKIGKTAAGGLGCCGGGPVMVIYPEGVWYAAKTKEDIDRIVDTHLVGGALVEDLAFMPR